jgi:two-component system CheB/CheR fusion protein
MSERVTTEPTSQGSAISLVVGIGASAGGLEALERLFDQMPEKTGCAFIVVQHLSPDFKSVLDELIARRTKIPVILARDNMVLEPDTIVLNTPKKQLMVTGGRIYLTDKDPTELVTYPIDMFFRSLAHEGKRAVAIVLSGTGSDGSRGLRDVHQSGGSVLVQSIESAAFDGMPQSAIETGVVDRILSPEEMPDALLERIKSGKIAPVPPETIPEGEPGMGLIVRLLRDAYGIDFSSYKPSTIMRRTERRAELARASTVLEFASRLAQSPEELDLLYKDLLIGVTRFFRDAAAFARLGRDVLPGLIRGLPASEELRIWVAGCATGEEAYSLAIVVREVMDATGRTVPVKIFATDVHQDSLRIAGLGIYDAAALTDVSAERRHSFFTPKDGRVQVIPEIRAMVVFAPHNVLKDAPFTNLDLVSCRNLLIYFEPPAQRKVLGMFHFGLRTQGYLFLGPSETPGDLSEEFDTVDTHWKIFRKRRDIRLAPDVRFAVSSRPRGRTQGLPLAATSTDTALFGAYDALLDEFMPPGFLVGPRRELAHSFGGASQYLRPRDGRQSHDLADMLEGDLRVAILGAVQRVFAERTPVVYKGMRVELPSGTRLIDVSARPVRSRRGGELYALVVLSETATLAVPPLAATEVQLDQAAREHVVALETELKYTRENLQSTIEELETSNEELQATNEELVASNEELQSTNEELHSVNEELHTVNGEFQRKISELVELNADIDHLQIATEVHTLFVDRQLCIRKFTPRIAATFNLMPHDIGRSIEVFAHSLKRPSLVEDIRRVATTGEPFEAHVQDASERWYLLRILPYRRGGNLDGAVLTLIDVTGLRRAQAETERVQLLLSSILKNSPSQIFIQDPQHRYVVVDDGFAALAGSNPIGRTAEEIFPPECARALSAGNNEVISRGAVLRTEIQLPGPLGPRTYLSLKFPLRAADGTIAVGGINTDISSLKKAEEELRDGVVQRDRFLATLSHELRNPLAAIGNAVLVLGRSALTAEQQVWQQMILEGTQHLTRLLDDLIDVARLTQNKMTLERSDFDLRRIVGLALQTVSASLADKQIELVQHLAAEPVLVSGDEVRLQQVLVNLLVNAVRYTGVGGRVTMTIDSEDSSAFIRVSDNGLGIEPEMLERVFEPFVQGHLPGARGRDGGLGVGLSLVRHIVTLHGGTVTAASQGRGRGSEFVVRLPRLPAAPALSPAPSAPPPGTPPAGMRLLLVEDEVNARKALKEILSMDGLEVLDVDSGEAALEAAAAARPDVVLLDIGLPGIDGYETCRRLHARYAALPVVALTGFGQSSDVARAKEAGFIAHTKKPIDLDELYTVLAAVHATVPTTHSV